MNASLPVRATSTEWTVARGDFYIMTPDDFPEGCGIIFNPDTGEQWGVGKTALGHTAKVRLYTPLCNGCDAPIPSDGLCHDCQTIHVLGEAA